MILMNTCQQWISLWYLNYHTMLWNSGSQPWTKHFCGGGREKRGGGKVYGRKLEAIDGCIEIERISKSLCFWVPLKGMLRPLLFFHHKQNPLCQCLWYHIFCKPLDVSPGPLKHLSPKAVLKIIFSVMNAVYKTLSLISSSHIRDSDGAMYTTFTPQKPKRNLAKLCYKLN